ncbi:MAG TPA: TetR/AcrR family transcriptional regulator [Actinomycetota bacterium]
MANVKTERISEVLLEKPRREPLTRERIVRTALRIMDDEGLEALSMRRIGRELGVEAMSLYNHVEDKEDILDSICEAVVAEFQVPLAEDWADGARRAAREYRRLLLAHPTVITLMTERKRPFTNPESLRAYEFALEVFRTAGLSEADAVKAFHVFGGYILGFVTMELGLMVGGHEDEAHVKAHEEMVRMLETADLPRMREAMPHFVDCNLEEQFEFGLDLLIEGIKARIAATE